MEVQEWKKLVRDRKSKEIYRYRRKHLKSINSHTKKKKKNQKGIEIYKLKRQ